MAVEGRKLEVERVGIIVMVLIYFVLAPLDEQVLSHCAKNLTVLDACFVQLLACGQMERDVQRKVLHKTESSFMSGSSSPGSLKECSFYLR